MHIHTCGDMHVCVHAQLCMHIVDMICEYVYGSLYVYICVCVWVMCVCVCICVCVCLMFLSPYLAVHRFYDDCF